MKKNLIAGLIIIAALSWGCESDNPPSPGVDANFSVTGYEQTAPATLVFINTSTNATSYLWNFGDGNTSTSQQVQHVYNMYLIHISEPTRPS